MRPALAHPEPGGSGAGAAPYVPRTALRHLAQGEPVSVRTTNATAVFADVSGFTRLSERFARQGREGAELLAQAIDHCFAMLLASAYDNGASLLKFGGDALLLLFEGERHAERACRGAAAMQRTLRAAGAVEVGGRNHALRLSIGVHSGLFQLFALGDSHLELLVTGPAASAVVAAEQAAGSGEVVMTEATAALLPAYCAGQARGEAGRLLRGGPGGPDLAPGTAAAEPEDPAAFLSTAVRAHVLEGAHSSEHRMVTVGFLRFSGADALVTEQGAERAARPLEQLVRSAQRAADEHRVCFLGSDVDVDGGKIILTGGAPRSHGDDEARVLCALRRVLDEAPAELGVRAGAHRGFVFAGDIGPPHRRTYTVMGDAVNLAARLMAKAPPGALYATPAVLERSSTAFERRALAPFTVNGKARAVQAFAVGRALAAEQAVARHGGRAPLIGRERELAILERVLAAHAQGRGGLVELVGEPGIGTGRLIAELLARAEGVPRLGLRCNPATATSPYAAWRGILRALADVPDDAGAAGAAGRLWLHVSRVDPTLLPWLALIGIPMGIEIAPTAEVEDLAPEFRHGKLLEVVLALLRRHGTEPLLLRFEAAHQMDAASAELLAALTPSLPETRWLVAVTRREAVEGFHAPACEAVCSLPVAPLAHDAALRLAEALSEAQPLPPHLLAQAAERSGGNPRLLTELLRAASDGAGELPESVEAAAVARIDRLDAGDRALVRRASVLGARFEERLLADVLDGPAPAAGDPLWRRLDGLLERDGRGQVRFASADVRQAAYGGLPYRLRRELHAAVADRLAGDAATSQEDLTGALSYHLALAGRPLEAWGFARIAARRAAASFAFVDAAHLHERALAAARAFPVPRSELVDEWEALGRARVLSGELARGIADLRHARRLAAGDPVRRAELAQHAALAQLEAGALSAAARCARRALGELDGDGVAQRRLRLELTCVLASIRYRQGRMDSAAQLAQQVLEQAEADGHESVAARAHGVIGVAQLRTGRGDPAPHFERAIELHRRLGELDLESRALGNLSVLAYREGRWADAGSLWEAAASAALRSGDVSNAAVSELNLGELWSDQGHLEEAEQQLRGALRKLRGTGRDQAAAYATLMLGRACARAGRPAQARELLEAGRSETAARDARFELELADALLAELCVFDGAGAEALERCRLLGDGARLRHAPLVHRVRGAALAQEGDREGAEAALRVALRSARDQGADYEAALALDVLAGLGAAGEEIKAERDALLRRLGVVALAPYPLEAAAAPACDPAHMG